MIVDSVTFDQYCEALLLAKLGYTMYAQVDGREYQVKSTRMIGGDGRNLEVLVLTGWFKPERCWATLSDNEAAQMEQKGLFQ